MNLFLSRAITGFGPRILVDAFTLSSFKAEMQRAKTPYLPNIIGMGMAAPTILFHAQEEVKKELLPKLLSGEEIWCQGFSEPGA